MLNMWNFKDDYSLSFFILCFSLRYYYGKIKMNKFA